MIESFSGKYRWLSNFVGGVEQEYQAAKCKFAGDSEYIKTMTPASAKRFGRRVIMRRDWESIKLGVMLGLCRAKFSKEPYRTMLLETGQEHIQEGNTWHDTFWGVDLATGEGHNHLGKIIMIVRGELRQVGK